MNKLKVIILAAGQGERLRPLTKNIPKCMVDFFGKSILERQIDIFQKLGIDDISVVTGYCEQKINIKNITKLKNKNFMTTNMVESLFIAESKLNDSVIVSYGDIIFEPKIIKNLIDSRHDISIVIDKNWKDLWSVRFDNPLEDAESLRLDKNELILVKGRNGRKDWFCRYDRQAPHISNNAHLVRELNETSTYRLVCTSDPCRLTKKQITAYEKCRIL